MSSIASLGRVISGLRASQTGLGVTGHNISNVNTKGYTRQQLLQADSGYQSIGSGFGLKQVGLGVTMVEIRQIRDAFADKRYRDQNAVLNFYQQKLEATNEVEAILDEPYGESISKYLDNFWGQMQKLNLNPSGVEERKAFIQTAYVLIEKANDIMTSFTEYQHHVDTQVRDSVKRINQIIDQIKDYNFEIAKRESGTELANDLRDQRNLLLDELSGYLAIDYYEEPSGMLVVKAEGRIIVDGPFVTKLDLEQTVPMSPFVKPVWADTKTDVFKMNREVSSTVENDTGSLKALLTVRGDEPADLNTSWDDIALNTNKSVDVVGNSYLIPRLQKEFSMLIHSLANTVNDVLAGYGMGENSNHTGLPIFVPIKGVNGVPLPVMPTDLTDPDYEVDLAQYKIDIQALLIPGNIQINPALREDGGYNKLGTSSEIGNIGDNSLITELLGEWSTKRDWPTDAAGLSTEPISKKANFVDFYAEYVSELGTDGYLYKGKVSEKQTVVLSVENERQAMGAVSQDEELANMLKYQYAYSAAARMINVLDGMMDTVINKM
jgi:flagellar hook-associated protein 1 FlgK